MRELSIFVDESGSDGLSDRYYLLTVVMHDQSDSIADSIAACDDLNWDNAAPFCETQLKLSGVEFQFLSQLSAGERKRPIEPENPHPPSTQNEACRQRRRRVGNSKLLAL